MPSDVVPKSALQSPLLDRFRLILKERENQAMEFDGRTITTEEFVRVYEDVLSELTINSKFIINDLTIIAGDFRDHSKGIVNAICSRVLEVPVDQKMPCLYLMDSIVKNIGRDCIDYVTHFASHLCKVFCEVYRQVPSHLHSSMRRLFETWGTVFPSSVLCEIEDELQLSPRMNQPSSVLSSLRASESPRPSHGIHENLGLLNSRRQSDNVSVKNNIPLERVLPNLTTLGHGEASVAQRFPPSTNKFLPSSSGSGRPLSPSVVDDFPVSNSPDKRFERGSPSHRGHSRGRGRDNEIVDWPKRHCSGDFNIGQKNVATCSLGNRSNFEHDRPSNFQRSLDKKPIGSEHQTANGAVGKITKKAWQHTKEEEFDWDNMSPSITDTKASNFTQSSIPTTMDFKGRPFVNSLASSSPSDYASRLNWGISEQKVTTEDSQKAGEDSHQTQDGAFCSPRMLAATIQKLPVAGREQFSQPNNNGSSQNVNHFRVDGFPVSITDPLLQGSPTSSHSILPLPHLVSPLQQQPRPSRAFMNPRNSFSMNLAQPPQPAFVHPLHHQPLPPVSLPRPPYLGYAQFGQVGAFSNIGNNSVPNFQNTPPFQNASNSLMQFQGPVCLRPYSHVSTSHFSDSVANQPASINISGLLNSGLINSLVAQGLLPMMKASSEQDSIGVKFDPDLLKVRHESAVRALYEDLPRQCTTCGLRFKTQGEHSKHMDWHVTKNRLSKNPKQNSSRKWFVSTSMWLSGTESLGVEPTPGFLSSETIAENKHDDGMAVLADEDQTACALCGERFEDFYSDETEEWMYRGAIYLNTPCNRIALGIDRSQLGPIVHAKCSSETIAAST